MKHELYINMAIHFDMLSEANRQPKELTCDMSEKPLDNIKDIITILAMLEEFGSSAKHLTLAHEMATTPNGHTEANDHCSKNNSFYRHHIQKNMIAKGMSQVVVNGNSH